MTDINIATTSSDPRDVIDAFADREAVDPEALDRALADADGRAYFVDLLALRGAIRSDVAGRPQARGSRLEIGGRWKMADGRWRWAIAASIAIVAAAAGYFGGVRAGRVATPVASTPAATSTAEAKPAPAPTTVIRLERGVDWAERSGG